MKSETLRDILDKLLAANWNIAKVDKITYYDYIISKTLYEKGKPVGISFSISFKARRIAPFCDMAMMGLSFDDFSLVNRFLEIGSKEYEKTTKARC